jgi:hypothetical protein
LFEACFEAKVAKISFSKGKMDILTWLFEYCPIMPSHPPENIKVA